jgi:hypothetical protein
MIKAGNRDRSSGALAGAFGLLALLAGCTGTDPDLGHSVRTAIAAQAPETSYAGSPMEGSEAVVAIAAQRRYLEGRTKKLTPITATGDSATPTDTGNKNVGRTSPAPKD